VLCLWPMTLFTLLAVLLIVGVLLWALNQFPAIDPTIKKIIYVVTMVVLVLWLASGLLGAGTFNPRLW
jgi:hypothetical protein